MFIFFTSIVMRNMEIVIKMTFLITLILTAIMLIVFAFKCHYLYIKAMSEFIKDTSFRKEVPKVHNLQDKTGCQKYKVSVTTIAKLMPAKLSILISTKLKNQILSKANHRFLNTWFFPFRGYFLHALRIIAFNVKRFSVCFSIYMTIYMEKKSNGTCIFLLEICLIKQSRDLIGYD